MRTYFSIVMPDPSRLACDCRKEALPLQHSRWGDPEFRNLSEASEIKKRFAEEVKKSRKSLKIMCWKSAMITLHGLYLRFDQETNKFYLEKHNAVIWHVIAHSLVMKIFS